MSDFKGKNAPTSISAGVPPQRSPHPAAEFKGGLF